MRLPEPGREEADRAHRRRDDAQPQRALEASAKPGQILSQAVVIDEDLARPCEEMFALDGKADEALIAHDEGDLKVLLQLAQSC